MGSIDRAIEAGEWPLTVSAPDLARLYSVVIQGIAHQAQHGGTQEHLFGVVDMAMQSWPGDPASDDKCTGGTSPKPPPNYQDDDDSIDAADWRPASSSECVRRDLERTHSPGQRPEVDHVTP